MNKFYSKEKAAKRTAENYGDLIELMIARAFERRKLIELSLKNRKSYIGFVRHRSITKRGQSDVTLVPMASGYRSEGTLELHITTDYVPIIYEMIKTIRTKFPRYFGTSTLFFPGRKCAQLAYLIRKRIDCFSNPIDDKRCARYSATTVVVSPAVRAFM